MTENVNDENIPKLVSERITWIGFGSAMLDEALMGFFLLGGFGFAASMSQAPTLALECAYGGVGLLLVSAAIFGKFMRLTNPKNRYQTERHFKYPDGHDEIETSG